MKMCLDCQFCAIFDAKKAKGKGLERRYVCTQFGKRLLEEPEECTRFKKVIKIK